MYCSSTVTVSEVNYSNDRLLDTVDGRNPVPVDMVVYPIIYRVLYIPSGAGFLPTAPSKCPNKFLLRNYCLEVLTTLPMKNDRNPKRKGITGPQNRKGDRLPTIHFQVRTC